MGLVRCLFFRNVRVCSRLRAFLRPRKAAGETISTLEFVAAFVVALILERWRAFGSRDPLRCLNQPAWCCPAIGWGFA